MTGPFQNKSLNANLLKDTADRHTATAWEDAGRLRRRNGKGADVLRRTLGDEGDGGGEGTYIDRATRIRPGSRMANRLSSAAIIVAKRLVSGIPMQSNRPLPLPRPYVKLNTRRFKCSRPVRLSMADRLFTFDRARLCDY